MENQKIHILMLPSWYLPEGGQFCRNQSQVLNEAGVEVRILANVTLSSKKYKHKLLKYLKRPFLSHEDNLEVLRRFTVPIPKLKATNGLLWSNRTLKVFNKYVKKYGKPDIIHVHSVLWGGYAAYLIKKKYNIPYVITEHKGIFGQTCEYAKRQFPEWQTKYMQKAFSNADAIVPVSRLQIPKIKEYLDEERYIQVISNVVDTDFFHFKERTTGSVINFVAVNGFTYVKAYDILLPAFDKACEIMPNISIKIVGEDFEGKEFERLWKNVKHKEKIIFTGELDADGVRNELWNSNIYIISSRVEAQPVSTLEALSTGLPVVCTSVVPNMVATNQNSIVVPVENIKALSEAIIKMANTYKNYDGQQISEAIKKVAGKEALTKNLISLYHKIID